MYRIYVLYKCYVATSQLIDIQQIWALFAINQMERKWKFCIFKKLPASEMTFFGTFFCLKNEKTAKMHNRYTIFEKFG